MSDIFGEARIAILPIAGPEFRTKLIAEIEAAKKGVFVNIPVNVVGARQGAAEQRAIAGATKEVAASANGAALAAEKEAAALRDSGAAANQNRVQQNALARVQQERLVVAERLSLADIKASLTSTTLAGARARLTQIDAAVAAAEREYEAAILSKDKALIASSEAQLQDVVGKQASARAAVRAAIAEEELAAGTTHRAEAQRFAARGAGAGILNLLGLRGAMLAANASFLAGAAGFIAFSKAVGLASNLEQQLNVFRVTARATAEEMEQVREEAHDLGADLTLPGVSAADAAVAMETLAKAGLSVQDSLAGARGVLQLATAAQIENADATEIVANALNSFGLAGNQAERVADALANASIEAQGSITDMGAALTSAASVSRQVGIGLEDTVALISLLAKNGIQGAAGGTVLRVALLRLVNPSEKAAAIIQKLGLRIRDAQGNVRPEVFADFAKATRDLSRAQQDAFAAEVFGTRGIRAQAILGREGVEAFRDMRGAVERAGAAQELAAAQTAGFSGKVEGLKNSLETLGTSLGALTLGPLGIFIDSLSQAANSINKVVSGVQIGLKKLQDLPTIKLGPIEFDTGDSGGVVEQANKISEQILKRVVGPQAGFVLTLNLGVEGVEEARGRLNQVRGDAAEAGREINKMFAAFRGAGGGATALNELVIGLQKMADKLQTGDEEAQRLAKRIQTIIKFIQDTGNLPPVRLDAEVFLKKPDFKPPTIEFPAKIDFGQDPTRESRDAAKESANAFKVAFGDILSPKAAHALGFDWVTNVGEGGAAAGPEAGANAGRALKVGLEGELAIAEAAGTSDAALLVSLRAREKRQKAFFDRFAAIKNRTAAQQKTFEAAAAQLNATRAAITAILDKQTQADEDAAAKRKKASDDAIKARNEADAAVLKQFGIGTGKAEGELIAAASTERLSDDIKANVHLRAVIRKQINAAKTRIKDLETQRDFIRASQKRILQITNDIISDRKRQADQIAQQAQEARDFTQRHLESILSIAETTDTTIDNRRALNALIAFDKQQIARLVAIRKSRKLTREEKEQLDDYRVDLAQRNQALRELGEEAKKGTTAAQRAFEFLQAQQGFAANLLGNLVPLGALSGTVGGSLPFGGGADTRTGSPATSIQQQAAAKASHDQGGFTGSQPATVIELLRGIVRELQAIRKGNGHPEASYHKKATSGGSKAQPQ